MERQRDLCRQLKEDTDGVYQSPQFDWEERMVEMMLEREFGSKTDFLASDVLASFDVRFLKPLGTETANYLESIKYAKLRKGRYLYQFPLYPINEDFKIERGKVSFINLLLTVMHEIVDLGFFVYKRRYGKKKFLACFKQFLGGQIYNPFKNRLIRGMTPLEHCAVKKYIFHVFPTLALDLGFVVPQMNFSSAISTVTGCIATAAVCVGVMADPVNLSTLAAQGLIVTGTVALCGLAVAHFWPQANNAIGDVFAWIRKQMRSITKTVTKIVIAAGLKELVQFIVLLVTGYVLASFVFRKGLMWKPARAYILSESGQDIGPEVVVPQNGSKVAIFGGFVALFIAALCGMKAGAVSKAYKEAKLYITDLESLFDPDNFKKFINAMVRCAGFSPCFDVEDDLLEEINDWKEDAQRLLTSRTYVDRFTKDPKLIQELDALHTRYERYLPKMRSLKGTEASSYIIMGNKLATELRKCRTGGAHIHKRPRPVSVCFAGTTRQGKSTLTNLFAKTIWELRGEKEEFEPYRAVYDKTFGEQYWSKYGNQAVTRIDEYLQSTDAKTNGELLVPLLTAMSTSPCPLNTPFEDKGEVFFTSHGLVLCTNNTTHVHSGIQDNAALFARYDLFVKVRKIKHLTKEEIKALDLATLNKCYELEEIDDPRYRKHFPLKKKIDLYDFVRCVSTAYQGYQDPDEQLEVRIGKLSVLDSANINLNGNVRMKKKKGLSKKKLKRLPQTPNCKFSWEGLREQDCKKSTCEYSDYFYQEEEWSDESDNQLVDGRSPSNSTSSDKGKSVSSSSSSEEIQDHVGKCVRVEVPIPQPDFLDLNLVEVATMKGKWYRIRKYPGIGYGIYMGCHQSDCVCQTMYEESTKQPYVPVSKCSVMKLNMIKQFFIVKSKGGNHYTKFEPKRHSVLVHADEQFWYIEQVDHHMFKSKVYRRLKNKQEANIFEYVGKPDGWTRKSNCPVTKFFGIEEYEEFSEHTKVAGISTIRKILNWCYDSKAIRWIGIIGAVAAGISILLSTYGADHKDLEAQSKAYEGKAEPKVFHGNNPVIDVLNKKALKDKPQSVQSGSYINQEGTRLTANLRMITVYFGSVESAVNQMIVMVNQHVGFICRHLVDREDITRITIGTLDGSVCLTFLPGQYKIHLFNRDETAVFELLGNHVVSNCRDIRGMIPALPTTTKVRQVVRYALKIVKGQGVVQIEEAASQKLLSHESWTTTDITKKLWYVAGAVFDIGTSVAGDCGNPYLGFNGDQYNFRWIHTGLVGTRHAVVTAISRQHLADITERDHRFLVKQCLEIHPYEGEIPAGLHPVGNITKFFPTKQRTAFDVSPVHIISDPELMDVIPVTTHIPFTRFAQSPCIGSSFIQSCRFQYQHYPPLSSGLMSFMESEIELIMKGFCSAKRYVKFNIVQAVFGHKGLKSMDMTTSVGPTIQMLFPTRIKRTDWIDIDQKTIDPWLVTEVFRLLEQFANGDFEFPLVRVMEKDEALPFSKTTKRLYYAWDLAWQIIQRMVFGDVLAHNSEYFIEGADAVGINPHGADWTALATKLNKHPKKMDTDFSKMDVTFKLYFYYLLFLYLNNRFRYKKGSRDYNILFGMCMTCGQPLLVFLNHIAVAFGLNVSGWFLTCFVNGFCGFLVCAITSIVLFGQKFGLLKVDHTEHIEAVTFGDDMIRSCSAMAEPVLDPHIFAAQLYELFGMIITGTVKSEAGTWHSDLESCTFISRGFLKRGGLYFAPLKFESMHKMLHWIQRSKTCSQEEVLQSICNSLVIELVVHGRKVYREYKERYRTRFELCGAHWPQKSYAQLYAKYLAAYTQGTLPVLISGIHI